jgi:hypothetical protein
MQRDRKLKFFVGVQDILRYLSTKGFLFPVTTSGFIDDETFLGAKTGGPVPGASEGIFERDWRRSTQNV